MRTTPAIATARSLLFVPGDRPDRFERALASGADAVVVDLEDAVDDESKAVARRHVIAFCGRNPNVIAVRVNDPRTDHGMADLRALADLGFPAMAVVPKADDPEVLENVSRRLPRGSAILPLIETAAGVLRALEVARSPRVIRLIVGHLDLAAELGIDPSDDERLWPARFAVIAASAAAGLPAPVDGITTAPRDVELIARDAQRSVKGGFGAKLCIHPDQVRPVHSAFKPSADEVSWAQRVVEASSRAAVTTVDGRMVDRPVVLRASSLLARAGKFGDRPADSNPGPSGEEPK